MVCEGEKSPVRDRVCEMCSNDLNFSSLFASVSLSLKSVSFFLDFQTVLCFLFILYVFLLLVAKTQSHMSAEVHSLVLFQSA